MIYAVQHEHLTQIHEPAEPNTLSLCSSTRIEKRKRLSANPAKDETKQILGEHEQQALLKIKNNDFVSVHFMCCCKFPSANHFSFETNFSLHTRIFSTNFI